MPRKFRKRFRCGRIVLSPDGSIKKLGLNEGGGSRYCNWYHGYMNFETVRENLVKLYHLGDVECEISLYDYCLQPLNQDKYPTVWRYVRDNGLNCNSTILYLCTRQTSDESLKKIVKKKKKNSTVESNSSSSTPSIKQEHSVKIDMDIHSKQTASTSFPSEHSYSNMTNDLVKYLQDLILRNMNDQILIDLFKNICILHGYVSSRDRLRNLFIQSNNNAYHNYLKDIENICESINAVINLNRETLNKFGWFSIFKELFISFYQNIKNSSNCQIDHFQIKTEPVVPSSSSFVYLQ